MVVVVDDDNNNNLFLFVDFWVLTKCRQPGKKPTTVLWILSRRHLVKKGVDLSQM